MLTSETALFLLATKHALTTESGTATYRGKTKAWANGRQMTKFDTTEFIYNGQRRRSKGSISFTYDKDGRVVKQSNGLEFIYDQSGIAGKKNNATYFYCKDAQGNIAAILDSNGNVVVEYKYDSWGNHAVLSANGADLTDATHIGNRNPFRYRGYFYDVETGLYYLQTRYYDPEIGRFVTIDDLSYADPEQIHGHNLYAYCGNNPVMNVDPTGHAFLVFLIAALIGFGVSFGASAVTQAINNEGEVDWGVAVIDGLFGAVSGALWMVPGLGPVATGLINAGLTAVNGVITTGIQNNWQYTWKDGISIAASSILSGVTSFLGRRTYVSSGGRHVLEDTHKIVGNITNRIVTGAYNDGVHIFSRSFRSAAGQMISSLIKLNFDKGFYWDWIATGLQALFSVTFSRAWAELR